VDITDIKLGMMVRTGLGKVGKVKEINRAGVVIELPNGEEYGAGFNCIEPEYTSGISIEDVRLGMELVTTGGIQGKVVAISKEGGLWLETGDRTRFPVHVECVKPATLHFYCDDSLPFESLFEVAKCYKQVEPDQLLMSQEARRVLQLLAEEGPTSFRDIAATFGGNWCTSMDGIIELLDAGRIRLVDGKYSIVRD